jgi:hypothetical protein
MTGPTRTAGLLAVMIGLAALQVPAPASAGGITMMITPQGQYADIIQQGLQIYSIVNQFKKNNHAKVNQKGVGNAAAVSQKGIDNYGLVVQRGRDHTATIAQQGANNALGVFQFGRKTNIDLAQTGQGNLGLLLQGGW